jgi:hypothetical protein
MTRYRQAVTLVALPLLLAAAPGAPAKEPAAIAADPMYMAVYGPERRVASIDVPRALPVELPVASGSHAYDQEDFALNDSRGKNPFQHPGTED